MMRDIVAKFAPQLVNAPGAEAFPPVNSASAPPPLKPALATVIVLGAVMAASLRFLSLEWSVNPQYSFGWGVPFLAAYLFWKRWADRPNPMPAKPLFRGFFYGFGALLALAALPLRVLLEANPDWRMLLWCDAALYLAVAFLAIFFIGGQPWAKHFWMPLAFVLLAVPWPTRGEKAIIDSLTHDISAATVEAVNWLGIPAVLHGNIIQLRHATLGVSEACSGIRSFQTTLMAGVFFGELYRLGSLSRFVLIGTGLAWGVFLNFLRTTTLTWVAATRSAAAEASLHDSLGLAGLVLAIAGILVLALLLAKKRAAQPDPAETPAAHSMQPRFLSWRAVVLIAAALVSVETLNEMWFRSKEQGVAKEVGWTVAWPKASDGFARQTLSDEVLSLLRCDQSQTGLWTRPDGAKWTMYFIKWLPGRVAAQLARGHTPDVCMTHSGFTMVAETNALVYSLPPGNASLPFENYIFKADGKPWYVFFCLHEDRVAPHAPLSGARDEYLSELSSGSRLRAAWDGKRFYGQQVFEIAMEGYASLAQARAALRQALPQLVEVSGRQ